MLVLTRKNDEQIIIDREVRITVLAIKGSRVRLGIEAPDHVGVRRAELDANLDGLDHSSLTVDSQLVGA